MKTAWPDPKTARAMQRWLGSSQTPLMFAAAHGRLEMAQSMIRDGANLHACDEDGWNALMWAAAQGQDPMVRFLVESGCHPEGQLDRYAWSALMLAAHGGHIRVFQTLLEMGGDPQRLLSTSAFSDGARVIDLIINIKDREEFTALIDAWAQHQALMRVLPENALPPDEGIPEVGVGL